jgi:hypothetical protein
MRADIRLWTAVAVIGACGCAVAWGSDIVRFSLATANIDSSENREKILNSWSAVPLVASAALRAELSEKIDTSDAKATNSRREALATIVAIQPLSPVNWMLLSAMQLVTDQRMDQVFDSLELSMVTGPNEGYLMPERGIYGVSLWPRLPPDLKRRVANDLTAAEIVGNVGFRATLSAQPEGVRDELRAAMLANGLSPQQVEQRLGP